MKLSCPLCDHQACHPYHSDSRRNYYQCKQCELVYVERQQHLSNTDEKAIYDTHQNDVDDPGYQTFLNPVAQSLLSRLYAPCHGLDFDCGPGPALAKMLRQNATR